MSESEGLEINGGRLQDFTIDQAAGALALGLGAIVTCHMAKSLFV